MLITATCLRLEEHAICSLSLAIGANPNVSLSNTPSFLSCRHNLSSSTHSLMRAPGKVNTTAMSHIF